VTVTTPEPSNARHLTLATISFAVCFAGWGLISAFAPRFREAFSLSATQTALLVAVPVLLGSLARLPVGMLADRFGGRLVFTVLMLLVAVPAWLVPTAGSYRSLLWIAFFLGIAGSSFPVGVGYVSRWTAAERQGSALGVYGLGNIGQSAAVFLGPLLAAAVGWANIYRGMAVLLVAWGIAFGLLARDAPVVAKPKGVADMLRVLTREKLSWVLALFYFLTFGGFVADNVWRTTDGGATWTPLGRTLPAAPVLTLAIHPRRDDHLYVGTEVGVFGSDDGGATWSPTNEGPANVSINELFWAGQTLYAATHGRGMYRIDLSGV